MEDTHDTAEKLENDEADITMNKTVVKEGEGFELPQEDAKVTGYLLLKKITK